MQGLKAPALAYFMQFSIRADLRKAIGSSLQKHDLQLKLSGYLELEERMKDILSLIRTKHVVDEQDLASIGLSLYDFPTISHFFVGAHRPVFVYEATFKQIRSALDFAYSRVFGSDIWQYATGADSRANSLDDVDPDAIHTLIDRMSLTQLQRESQPDDTKVTDERLFVVDLAAPVSVLKKQFLAAIERIPKQKITMGSDFFDLAKLGILPFIDLENWQQWIHGKRIKRNIQAMLIYGRNGTVRQINQRTIPIANKMLEANSAPFTYLTSKAAEDLDEIVEHIRQQKPKEAVASPTRHMHLNGEPTGGTIFSQNEKTEEILSRWLPRTYPYNIPDLKRTALVFPDAAENLGAVLESVDQQLEQNISDRILSSAGYASDGSALLRVMRELLQATEGP